MSKELEGAVRLQLDLYGRIARAYDNLKKSGSANITQGLVEARLQALENNWSRFEDQHQKLVAAYWEQLSGHEYLKNDMLSMTEEAYVTQKGLFLDTLRMVKNKMNEESSLENPTAARPPRTTLPRIQLPQFSGRYEEWPPFRDLFHSIIGKDASITAVEKLHYLKSCLKSEAESLIRSLPTTAENFGRGWQILTDFYENKRLLVRSYLAQFASLQKLKSEFASDLRKLYHTLLSIVSSLESIGRPITRGEDLFVYLAVELLDARSRREWENAISETTEPSTYVELQQFLDRRLHALESLQPSKSESVANSKPGASSMRQTRVLHSRKLDGKPGRCSLCSKDHYILFCESYKGKTAEERKQHVESSKLCLNCLGKHSVSECASKKACSVCDTRHHTSLHDACRPSEIAKISHLVHRPPKPVRPVLLATARVNVTDRFGQLHLVRALIDQGSESSLVAESLVQRLSLPRSPTTVTVYGIGRKRTGVARGLIEMLVRPRRGGSPLTISALVLPKLTLYDGAIRAGREAWAHLKGLELADPEFLSSDSVELLLGADVYAEILESGLRRGGKNEPIAQQTSLGWILSGAIEEEPSRVRTYSCRVADDLLEAVRRFWQQEELGSAVPALSTEDNQCEEFFKRTCARRTDGRYIVRLPVLAPLPDLSETRRSAIRLLHRMEARFARDDRLRQLYKEFMLEYETLGHMAPSSPGESSQSLGCFLPHHGVFREISLTTKLRVVFNGSSTVSSGDSLNRHLMVGPNLLPALMDILLRWRRHRYVITADIEKMYRQILVDPRDRTLQRVMWRHEEDSEPQEYRLATVTYGLACAPYLAMRTLQQLADDEGARFPRGAEILRQDLYMDDVLTGASSLEDAKVIQIQLIALCTAGGFPLRKWSANAEILLAAILGEHRMSRESLSWRPQDSHATLGLQWHPGSDCFSFLTRTISASSYTKRSVLSLMARLFDPLGWLTPVVARAKIIFQSTWLKGVDWDSPLDDASTELWSRFQADLERLETLRVPRRLEVETDASPELHGFADASERAYAAVVYLRTVADGGNYRVRIIVAKTKVAPLQQVTLPRLELCAAHLLARLTAHIRRELDVNQIPVHLWSDSTVTLSWIQCHSSRWKTYVANRVSDIQTTLPTALWHHLPGTDNPADCASRGLSTGELIDHPLWWTGPRWLTRDPPAWPIADIRESATSLKEVRVSTNATETRREGEDESEELTRFSSLTRLLRVTAWCLRCSDVVPLDQQQREVFRALSRPPSGRRLNWFGSGPRSHPSSPPN